MKKAIDVNIGKVKFTIEDDAYYKLKVYLANFEESLPNKEDAAEIMEDVEIRIAELFQKEIKYPTQVIDIKAVNAVIEMLGEVDSNYKTDNNMNDSERFGSKSYKKLYRDPDDKKIAGVCSGLALYLNIDTTLIRILFVILLLGGGSALIAYIILWIAMPEARTIAQKLEMRGEPVTAENIKYYSGNFKK